MDMKDLTVPHGNGNKLKSEQDLSAMKSIHDVCKEFGITRKTLFYYDKINLLKPSKRVGPQKVKFYGPTAINKLKKIIAYQNAGLSLKEIDSVLNGKASLKDILSAAIVKMEEDIKETNRKLEHAKQLLGTIKGD